MIDTGELWTSLTSRQEPLFVENGHGIDTEQDCFDETVECKAHVYLCNEVKPADERVSILKKRKQEEKSDKFVLIKLRKGFD